MFDLPEAKRVRRADLYSRSSSRSTTPGLDKGGDGGDPEVQNAIQRQFAELFGIVEASPIAPIPETRTQLGENADVEGKEEHEEQEFEFRLFSSAKATGDAAMKVVLSEDEDEELGPGGFVTKPRPLSYFLAPKAEGRRKAEYEAAAVEGDTILGWSRQRAWGLEVPWRVKILRVSSTKKAVPGLGVVVEDGKKRKPGKKRRIILREKKRKIDKVKLERMKQKELKGEDAKKREEEDREKRTRRNREKKVKRKMKEKAKKAGVLDQAGGSEAGVEATSGAVPS